MLPGPDGELITRKGAMLDREQFSVMLTDYYRARNWNAASGLQTQSGLRALGLGWCAGELKRLGALGSDGKDN